MNGEISVEAVLEDIETAKEKQKDMFSIMWHPTPENVTAFYEKYEPETWAAFSLPAVMVALYKVRFALDIEKVETLKWLKDHDANLDVLDDLESDLKDMSVPVKKPGFWR